MLFKAKLCTLFAFSPLKMDILIPSVKLSLVWIHSHVDRFTKRNFVFYATDFLLYDQLP